jgi:hypothetical protein
MSDTGLYGSIYQQLRHYADKLDRALVRIRSTDTKITEAARKEIALLLRELCQKDTSDPSAQLVSLLLKQQTTSGYGKDASICESLADILDKRMPNQSEISKLQDIATAIDRECSDAMARLRGRT